MINSKPGQCIDRIVSWLDDTTNLHYKRVDNQSLRLSLRTEQGIGFTVYVLEDFDFVLIESLVFRAISSSHHENISAFYETLLAYNSAIRPFSFAMILIAENQARLMLSAAYPCRDFKREHLENAVGLLNVAFSKHIPRLKELARELNLQFNGSVNESFGTNIDFVLERV